MNKITCNINRYGDIIWYYHDGSLPWNHNNNGPASEFAFGNKLWAVSGKYHRLDGPAVEYTNGNKAWYINHVEYKTELEYWIAVQALQ